MATNPQLKYLVITQGAPGCPWNVVVSPRDIATARRWAAKESGGRYRVQIVQATCVAEWRDGNQTFQEPQ